MNRVPKLAVRLAVSGLLLATTLTFAAEVTPDGERYTAQRRPRITVLRFNDANAVADQQRYGASVEAMMVTFLKRKSQLVVVERQRVGDILDEWQRSQIGRTNLRSDDPGYDQLLEKVDAILVGTVTLLESPAETAADDKGTAAQREAALAGAQASASASSRPEKRKKIISGPRIEIDVKLLSRADGRIIAAAQRRGPVVCLRSIVERLGVELERAYLRPYYGKLRFSLSSPENVRIYLTPILLDTALDEEKPPVERSATVIVGDDNDLVQPWATSPTTYTIENLLSGWYSLRLARPGYEGLQAGNDRWLARSRGNQVVVYDKVSGKPLREVPQDLHRFVVRVDARDTEEIDGDKLQFSFRKRGGSIEPRIRRQFLDPDFTSRPARVLLYGAEGIELNDFEEPDEYADDETCDLFDEVSPSPSHLGPTHVTSQQKFDLEKFTGGKLLFDDYRGEVVPAGKYTMILWEPGYQLLTTEINVQDQDQAKAIHTSLVRETQPLILTTTGPRPRHKVELKGQATGHRIELPLSFEGQEIQAPVDSYTASTGVPGLGGWRNQADLVTKASLPPAFSLTIKEVPPLEIPKDEPDETAPARGALQIKTRFSVGGRLSVLSSLPRSLPEELYIDRGLEPILDRLLPEPEEDEKDEEEARSPWRLFRRRGPDSNVSEPPAVTASSSASMGPPTLVMSADFPLGALASADSLEPEELEREVLVQALARHLKNLDLLVLDDRDMARLREMPEAASLIRQYLEAGGALYAFASEPGDYASVVGSSLLLESVRKKTARFHALPGEVSGINLPVRKRIRVKSRRVLPKLAQLEERSPWRIVAFHKDRKGPRIIEKGSRDQGGYVVVWCDRPASFRGQRAGNAVPEVESARAEIERHVLGWARFLMYRRYDSSGGELRRAQQTLYP